MKKTFIFCAFVLLTWALKDVFIAKTQKTNKPESNIEESSPSPQAPRLKETTQIIPVPNEKSSVQANPHSLQNESPAPSEDFQGPTAPPPDQISPEELAQEKLHIPIEEEIKNAIPISAWTSSEWVFARQYLGQVNIKGQPYTIRMNLTYKLNDNTLRPDACVAMYGSQNVVFKESYGNGNIRFLRTGTENYILVAVLNRFYLRLFGKKFDRKTEFITHLVIAPEKSPFVFTSREFKNGSLDDCENI